MIIGITGKSGAGKSYVSEKISKRLDMIHLDIDKISHEVLTFENTIKFILKTFGHSVFDNGQINRKKLGKIVFNDTLKLKTLNDFCQNQIEKQIDKILSSTNKSVVLDYALLCKLKQFELCDVKILLNSDINTRFNRVAKRENISREYFLSRDNSIDDFNGITFDYIYENISESEIENLIIELKNKEQSWSEKLQ